jgi:hypothetical protein
MTPDNHSDQLTQWIDYVFDRPIDPPRVYWYFADDAPDRDDHPPHPELLLAQTFERSGTLLAKFSDDQLSQGIFYLGDCAGTIYSETFLDPDTPLENRLRALRSFVPLFEQIMAARCSPHLSNLDEKGANPLNGACYMWWDNLAFHYRERKLLDSGLGDEIVRVLRDLLTIPHDAIRESTLHGIGHLVKFYPQLTEAVDKLLSTTPDLRPELIEYAKHARAGEVL